MAFLLQPRDILLLTGLLDCRLMSLEHFAFFYFEGSKAAATKRVQKLKAAGYVRERPRQSYEPALHFLTTAGISLLSEEGILADYPPASLAALSRRMKVSDLTIRHELGVLDVKMAFAKAAKARGIVIAEFSTWPALFQFSILPSFDFKQRLIQPDAFIRLEEGADEHCFFLELDRSTETVEGFATRLRCYLDYYRSGAFAVWRGGTKEDVKEIPFQVLVVCKSAARRDTIAKALLNGTPQIRTQTLLSTLAEVKEKPFEAIWREPRSYEKASDIAAISCI